MGEDVLVKNDVGHYEFGRLAIWFYLTWKWGKYNIGDTKIFMLGPIRIWWKAKDLVLFEFDGKGQ